MIVGLVGLIGAGKGTVADLLVDRHHFIKESFANSVKDSCAVVFGWDRAMLEGIPDGEPFSLRMMAIFERPTTGKKPIPLRPDLDNIVKLVLDALQGKAFKNDSYCWAISAQKCYGEHDSLAIELSWK